MRQKTLRHRRQSWPWQGHEKHVVLTPVEVVEIVGKKTVDKGRHAQYAEGCHYLGDAHDNLCKAVLLGGKQAGKEIGVDGADEKTNLDEKR